MPHPRIADCKLHIRPRPYIGTFGYERSIGLDNRKAYTQNTAFDSHRMSRIAAKVHQNLMDLYRLRKDNPLQGLYFDTLANFDCRWQGGTKKLERFPDNRGDP